MRRRVRAVAVAAALAMLAAGCASVGRPARSVAPRAARSTATTADVAGPVVVATADVVCSPAEAAAGGDGVCQSEATAAVAASLQPSAVLLAGDIQYEKGSAAEFAAGYRHSAWAQFAAITHPAVGNHEYGSAAGAPYFATFGAQAGPAGRGWYSFDVGSWHLIALNANCSKAVSCAAGSAQETWLHQDLARAAAQGRRCTLAFWHQPRYSSGFHGSSVATEALWADLAEAQAELVISGHDHDYERFAPERGVRQFVAGTGGRSLYPTLAAAPGSEVRNSSTFGVLELRLGDGAYSWRFVPVAGSTFSDAGTEACH